MPKKTNKNTSQDSKEEKKVNEGNKFDKIFKQNAEPIFLRLIEWQLGITIKGYKEFNPKMQTTLEREMDGLYEVETKKGEQWLLHIEFQSESDPDMLYRMIEYHGIATRKLMKPIKHLVIYLGASKPNMPNKLPTNYQFEGFDLLALRDLDTEQLLSSQVPEVIMLAILSKYPEKESENILRSTIMQLIGATKNKNKLNMYLRQLTMIANLRKLETSTLKTLQDMSINHNFSTSTLYQLGIDKGEQIGLEKGEQIGLEKGKEIGLEEGEKIGLEKGEQIGLEKGEQIGLEKGEQIGLEKGEQIGLEKGEQIGLEKGEQIGLEKGKELLEEERQKLLEEQKAKQDHLILQAIEMNILSLEQIAELFGVTLEYVLQLKEESNNKE